MPIYGYPFALSPGQIAFPTSIDLPMPPAPELPLPGEEAPPAGPIETMVAPRFPGAQAAAGALQPPAALPAPSVPPPAGGSVVWISEAWLAPRAVPYGCPDFPGYYCPRRPAAPMPAPGEEALLDEAAALPTPVAAKVATAGGLGALILVGLAAGGVFGR